MTLPLSLCICLLLAAPAAAGSSFACADALTGATPAARRLVAPPQRPVTGEPRLLVIFAGFADGTSTSPPGWAQDLFEPDLPGSVTHFYHTMSFGQLRIQGTVAPTLYRSSRTAASFVGESAQSLGPYPIFVRDILRQADADIDFSQFDGDGDGRVDAVAIALLSAPRNFLLGPATGVASLGQEEFVSNDDRGDGRPIRIPADQGTVQVAAGFELMSATISHEFAHLYGAPDLHRAVASVRGDTPERDTAGIGRWGVMGWGALGWQGDDGPNPFMAWTRVLFGWADIIDLAQASTQLRLEDATTTGQVARLRLPDGDEFLIENRQRLSWYDRNLPGEGLLIWHVDPSRIGALDLEAADGRWIDAGFPKGRVASSAHGGDNLDFWARNDEYRAAHVGNLGDGTDLFDGRRFTRFGAETNPDSWDASRTWSFELDSLRFDQGVALARLQLPEVVSFERINAEGVSDGLVVAGQQVELSFTLSGRRGRIPPVLTVRLTGDDAPVTIRSAAVDVRPLLAGNRRVYFSDHPLSFRVHETIEGIVPLSLSLEVFDQSAPVEALVWRHALDFTAVGARQRWSQVVVHDSTSGNGDGQLQAGELAQISVVFDGELDIDILQRLDLSLSPMSHLVRAFRSSRLRWLGDTPRARSSAWLVAGAAPPGASLPVQLEVRAGEASWLDTLSINIAAGPDPTPPQVGAPVIQQDRNGTRVLLPSSRLIEGTAIHTIWASLLDAEGAEQARLPLTLQAGRYEAQLPPMMRPHAVRVSAQDAGGLTGVSPTVRLHSDDFVPVGHGVADDAIVAMDWSPRGDVALATGRSVLVLEGQTLHRRAALPMPTPVTHVSVDDSTGYVAASTDRQIVVWEPDRESHVNQINVHETIDLHAADGQLAVATASGFYLFDSLTRPTPLRAVSQHGLRAIALQSRRLLMAGRADGRVDMWDIVTARRSTMQSPAFDASIHHLVRGPGGASISIDADGAARAWSTQTGTATHVARGEPATVLAIDADATSGLLATITDDGRVRVARIHDRSIELDTLCTGAMSLALEPGGRQLLVGTWSGHVHRFLLGSGAAAATDASPQAVSLAGAFPNPFNASVHIPFHLQRDATVQMRIHNVLGQPIRTLGPRSIAAGSHMTTDRAWVWDGRNDQGQPVASGVYVVRLTAGRFHDTTRLLLLR